MEMQRAKNNEKLRNSLEKDQSWRTHTSQFQKLLQSYSNQDNVFLA